MEFVKPSHQILAASGYDHLPFSYEDNLRLIEIAGRTCYKSEEKITDTSKDVFFDMLTRRRHFAMIEHSWQVREYNIPINYAHLINPRTRQIFLYRSDANRRIVAGSIRAFNEAPGLEGLAYTPITNGQAHKFAIHHKEWWMMAMTVKFICDRGVTHELVRHRPPAFAQESTRWCNYKGGVRYIKPFWMSGDVKDASIRDGWVYEHLERTEALYVDLVQPHAWKPEQARAILPNCLKTEIIVTTHLLEWAHIYHMRTAKDAHPQMREVMIPFFEEVKDKGYFNFFPEVMDYYYEVNKIRKEEL